MNTFRTFFFGGYECADHINAYGNRVDLLQTTAHDTRVEEDYILLSRLGSMAFIACTPLMAARHK